MIHRLPGPTRPCTRVIVFGSLGTVKQAQLSARRLLLLVAGMALFLCGFGPPQLVDREIGPTARVSVGELRSWAEQTYTPDLTAASYLLYDMGSGRVLYEHNSTVARAPASLTKLMTALLVFERGDLNAVVHIAPDDLVGGATMGLAVGDVVTVTDLLWGLLLPSGNDAASALARYMGGNVETFVAAMNARAQELGLSQTHFVNAHGLDAQGHVSSAADLLMLTRELWGYPLFRSMVGTARVQWNGRDLSSTNEWLTTFDGATGVKTGTTDEAGECLVASVERDGRTVLLVIMGSQARYEDATKLYDAFRSAYAWDTANGRELSIINRVYDENGRVWFMHPTGAAPIVLQHQPGVPEVRSFRRLDMPRGDLLAGTQVGVLEWWAGAEMIGAQALVVR
ncbi:MAG: D-alanyl-D-alanine carboxypeptidase [Caldilineaceae bacterium]|nr:D-alanyl-D-alanine carboxypeptidase [Caldilineaceae bacterium]